MTIGEVAERTGLSAHTIRFYERSGLLPRVRRSTSGIREFSAADVAFLEFLIALRATGMPLDEMAAFTADGCILERLARGDVPRGSVGARVALLEQHRQRLHAQRRQLDALIDAVDRKLAFYARYLHDHDPRDHERTENDDQS
jgi:DNA-binding transcriptional MerR regulator